MRDELKNLGSETRYRYRATVGRMGIKSNKYKGFPERTILLKDLIEQTSKKIVTDHIWFTVGKNLRELNLKEGDEIEFNARISSYRKGYWKDKTDYKLNRMTKINVIRKNKELRENEITSATEPSLEELWAAQAKHSLNFSLVYIPD